MDVLLMKESVKYSCIFI